MAGLDATIVLRPERRPCYVDGEKALFHKWIVDGPKNRTVGLVEFENGWVRKRCPYEITFCDNEIEQYAFPSDRPNLISLNDLVLKANTGESVFLVSEIVGIWEWALVRGEEIVETILGEFSPGVIFESGRKFLKKHYGITWFAYRKKPEK